MTDRHICTKLGPPQNNINRWSTLQTTLFSCFFLREIHQYVQVASVGIMVKEKKIVKEANLSVIIVCCCRTQKRNVVFNPKVLNLVHMYY